MDPRYPYAVSAPGARADITYAPARNGGPPAVDERIVAPESRAEVLDGTVFLTMGANEPHGTRHFEATMVFAGMAAEYVLDRTLFPPVGELHSIGARVETSPSAS